jgi:hypothetical protein
VEVNDEAAAVSDNRDSASYRRIIWLVVAHLIIAMAPVTLGLVTFSQYSLPYLWAVSSVPFAQIMLLAMWIGLGTGKPFHKLATAALSAIYISFWHALGTKLLGGESWLVEIFLRDGMQMLAILAVLSGVMFCLRRWLGQIQHFVDPQPLDTAAQTRYSLFTALSMSTAGSLFMALFSISMEKGGSESSTAVVAHIMLIMATLCLLLVSSIWAALAPGMVRYRIAAIAVLAALLGVSLAVSAGHTPAQGGWLMLAAASLIVVVPAAIVCGSLLYLRAGGYRLVRTPSTNSFRNSLTAV